MDKLLGNFSNTIRGGATIAGIKNDNYPEESYEEFIAKMIERKKEKITRIMEKLFVGYVNVRLDSYLMMLEK